MFVQLAFEEWTSMVEKCKNFMQAEQTLKESFGVDEKESEKRNWKVLLRSQSWNRRKNL